MTSEDKAIWQKALQYAFQELDRTSWDSKRDSKSYSIINNGKHYPNKLVLQKAEEYLLDNEYEKLFDAKSMNGGEPINNYLASKGAKVYSSKVKEEILKEDPNQEIIRKYKKIVHPDNSKEIYKWILIEKFQGRPNVEVVDFETEVTSINYQNLIYHNGLAVRNYLAKEVPEEYKKCYARLFDESINLHERILAFQDNVSRIHKSLGNTLHHHHDERTIATLLCFKYPDKYPLYKNSFYYAYCKLLGIKQAAKNYRYEHYIQLLQEFITDYIAYDSELLTIKSNFLTKDCYADPANLIFAQDILYQVLAHEEEAEEIEDQNVTVDPGINEEPIETNSNSMSLNQILYGPPGTGKTYKLKNDYFEKFTVKEESQTREQFLMELVSNFTWWQAITIVLLDLKRAKVLDILNHELIQIKERLSSSKTVRPTIWGQLQTHTILSCEHVKVVERSEPLYFQKDADSFWSIVEDDLKEKYPEAYDLFSLYKDHKASPNVEIKNYEFVTFHQSFSYEDFIEGIKPVLNDDYNGDIKLSVQDGVFKSIAEKARRDPKNKYALFIIILLQLNLPFL